MIKLEKYVLNDFGWKIYLNTPSSLIMELYNYTFEDEENYVKTLKEKKLIKNEDIEVFTYHNQSNSIYNNTNNQLQDEINLRELRDNLISDVTNIYKMIYFEYSIYSKYSPFIWTISCFMAILLLKKMSSKFDRCKNVIFNYLIFNDLKGRYSEIENCFTLITNNWNTMMGDEYEIDEDYEMSGSYSLSNGIFNSNDVYLNENDDDNKIHNYYNLKNNCDNKEKVDDDFQLVKKNSSPINSDFIKANLKNTLRDRIQSNTSIEANEETSNIKKNLFKKRISFINPSPSFTNIDFFQKKIIRKRKSKNLSLNDLKNLHLFNKLSTIDEEFKEKNVIRSSISKMKRKSKLIYIKTLSTEEESIIKNKSSNISLNKHSK